MKRRRKISSYQHSQNTFFFSYVLLFFVGALLLVGGLSIFPKSPPTLKPLALLKVPTKPTIYLPDPLELEFPPKKSWVLGAETIDPQDVILYINKERMQRGALPLRVNALLMKAAAMRANVILKYQNFSHQDPYEHIQLDTVLPMVNYPFVYASENIGMGDFSAQGFVNGFMNSTMHRENLLNPKLKETGVAIITGPYKQYYVNIAVQLFGIPATPEEYLGYSQEDVQQYKSLLSDLNSQIMLTRDLINHHVGNEQYYAGWQKILIRQQVIVSTVYDGMLHQQPMIDNFVSLIQEYNTNWNLTPKPTNS